MTRLSGTESTEELKQKIPRCPHCGSLDPQQNIGLAECNHRPGTGHDRDLGIHRAVAMNDEYDLHRHSFSQSPENEGLSWPHKIERFARSLWQGPKKSLIVLLQHERSNRWRMRTLNENPAMQIIADFYLTNITQEAVFIQKTFFVPYHGKGWFPSTLPVEGHADWWIQPPIKREGQTLRGRGCFVDQFDNEHWTAVLNWKYR